MNQNKGLKMKNLKKVLKEISGGKIIPGHVKSIKYKDIKDEKIRDEAYEYLLLIDKKMEKKGYGVIYDKNKGEVGLYSNATNNDSLKKDHVYLITEY